ncbi:MAG: nitroreductase family protein [candidate division Zixibacteria bacterium]|nr:nitroreductase family protein [candidate division Zixibacteria bacterium]
MEFIDVILKRRSIRAYKRKNIPEEILMRIIESARLAPSASNLQPWKFIIIRDNKAKQEIARLAKERMWIADASVIIAGVATNPDYRMGSGQSSSAIDIATAFAHMSLAATDEGLGTCWIGSFDSDGSKRFLGIPEKFLLVGLLTIGYPDEKPGEKDRKRIQEIICYEKWSD